MKLLSDKIITPITNADTFNGRINRKCIQNIFFIEIDRPQKLNGMTPFMFYEISKAFTEYENDNNAKCCLVYTSGKNFCSGMDLRQMSTLLKKKDHSWLKPKKGIDPLGLHKPFRSKPLIVAVKGVTFTYGLELMLSSDIALCGRKTSFAMLEALRGLLMTGGGTIRFVERAGWGNAMKYLLTGMKFDSKEAYRMHLVQEIIEENRLFTRAVELANMICNASSLAVKEIIKNARLALINKKKAINSLNKAQEKLVNKKDFKEGLESFLEKRNPDFNR